MQKNNLGNINFCDISSLLSPKQLKSQFPLTYVDQLFIEETQNIIINIIQKKDPRLLIICGPCSIHDVNAAFDYAKKLKSLSLELQDQLYIVMRVYLEKPRTTIGWKGLINDPYIDGSCDIQSGLKIARQLLLQLIKIKLPVATEILNPNVPQYIGDLFSWVAIGARTTESQIHREIASSFQSVIGFKNSTHGDIDHAINAIRAASMSHNYISIDQSGQVCSLHTKGNTNSHIILRGGIQPNYYPENIICCEKKITEIGLPITLMIDCSHGNSNKDYHRQIDVAQSILNQIKLGNHSIIGLMMESYIYPGNQIVDLTHTSSIKMQYGVSITDACIDWDSTERLLRCLHKELKPFLSTRLKRV
ncbi:phospho-2-dehydro-3-deoxyheptonate aldolase, tyr-sensitive [Candidatus Blochmanniella floridana]|uniref:Phospho-2-dehydro-3-deoxyheptonate aldolase n=1 Tax=Blochmanniella floridana TaxID=203907 RepID=Q7VQF7_BLOFL|nr:phospho-2-dehydro-3-deoxyheptonate aldolase, tyr-sensitive [Candidatus Blochmannia floridanus]